MKGIEMKKKKTLFDNGSVGSDLREDKFSIKLVFKIQVFMFDSETFGK